MAAVNDAKPRNFLNSEKSSNKISPLGQVAYGLLLFDDFLGVEASLHNLTSSVLDDKRFQGNDFNNIYFGVTGNTKIYDSESKLSNNTSKHFTAAFVTDDLTDFIKRNINTYKDKEQKEETKKIVGFLKDNPEFFSDITQKEGNGYVSARTWANFIEKSLLTIKRGGGKTPQVLEDIATYSSILLGKKVGEKFNNYYSTLNVEDNVKEVLRQEVKL